MTITMTFKVSELANTLSENKKNHTKIYDKALVDYRKATKKEHVATIKTVQKQIKLEKERHDKTIANYEKRIKSLEDDIVRVESDKNPKLSTIAQKPEHRKEEYTNVISMLKMTTDSEIELDNDQFSCYVQDKWIWQKQFLTNATQLCISGSLRYDPLATDTDYFIPLAGSASNDYMLDLYGIKDE
jgi:hypothetical protein